MRVFDSGTADEGVAGAAGPPRGAAVAGALLVAALIFYALLWPRAAWLLVSPGDRPVVERTLAAAAQTFGTTIEDQRWTARPSVFRSAGRLCVVIASTRSGPHGYGGYKACYDPRTGAVLEERAWL